jgi:hypothetical protein
MVLIAACLGLRVSEIMNLQWGDFDWENFSVMVRRSVVHGRVGDTKTEASFRPLPVDTRPMMAWTFRLVAGGGYDLPDTSVLPVALGKSNVYNHLQFAANTGQPGNSQCYRDNRCWVLRGV